MFKRWGGFLLSVSDQTDEEMGETFGALVVGSTIYKEEGKYYNRLLAVYPDGKYEYYDKHNCFKKVASLPKTVIWRWNGKDTLLDLYLL